MAQFENKPDELADVVEAYAGGNNQDARDFAQESGRRNLVYPATAPIVFPDGGTLVRRLRELAKTSQASNDTTDATRHLELEG